MIRIIRTDSSHPDFVALVRQLDVDLAERDGEEHSFYAQFNTIDAIRHVVVLYEKEKPLACGAIKEYAPGVFEVKRMFTLPSERGKGLASKVLNELEKWASEMKAKKCLLETGKKQPEAIRLYQKNGYAFIENYGQYAGVENSICFEKSIELQ